jgi:hypothetical protein
MVSISSLQTQEKKELRKEVDENLLSFTFLKRKSHHEFSAIPY